MATRYLDFEGGNDASDATTYANRVKTFAGLAGKIAAGDVVRIMASPAPTALGSCTWTNASRALTIPANTIKDVDSCDAAWTAATNVTTATSTNRKQGTNSNTLAIAAGFTTGIVAYKATGTLDLSAYQQINLWLQTNTIVATGVFRVDLCSDVAGATPVDSFTINIALNPINVWHSIVIDKGSALGSAIASVSIVALSDPGTVTLTVDNVFVSKGPSAADCLTLESYVRKTTPVQDEDYWYTVVSASGTSAEIGGHKNGAISNARTYPGTTETVATQVRQPIMQAPVTAAGTALNTLAATDGSSDSARISYSGGWDRTNMSTLDGETWLGVSNAMGTGLIPTSRRFLAFSKINFVGGAMGWQPIGDFNTYTDCGAYACGDQGAWNLNSNTQGKGSTFTRCYAVGYAQLGFRVLGGNPGAHTFIDCVAVGSVSSSNTTGYGFNVPGGDTIVRGCRAINNGFVGFNFSNANPDVIALDGCVTKFNGSAGALAAGTCDVATRNLVTNEATVMTIVNGTGMNARVICHRFNGGADDHRIYMYNALVTTETGANRRTASGYAYKFTITNGSNRTLIEERANFALGRFFVRAGQTFTYTIYVNRSASGTGFRIRIPGGLDASIASDVVHLAAGTAGTYEQLTVTVTPAADLEVPILAELWGATNVFAYIDDSAQTWTG